MVGFYDPETWNFGFQKGALSHLERWQEMETQFAALGSDFGGQIKMFSN